MVFPNLLQDLRYTARTLRRDAGFAAFAILIAGLGIGASVIVFSVVNTLLLRPLPFARPSELVWIANRDTSGLSGQTTQVGHMLDLRERSQTLSAIAGYFAFYGVGDNLLSGRGEPERLSGVPVSENFFDVLGVKPMLGRGFNAQETAWKGPKAVMLGYPIWERRFNRDPKIVGTALIINDEPHTVVGVLPASFDFATIFAPGSRFDLYFPFPLSPETNRWGNTMAMIGRLKAGATRGRRARGDPRAGAADRPRAPGAQQLRGHRPAAVRADQRQRPARRVGARGRGRHGHADRLRQPVEPAAGAHGGAAEGSRHPHGARRRTAAAAGAAAHRGAGAVVQRRRAGPAARPRRHAPADAARRGEHSAAARRADGRRRARLRRDPRARHRPRLRRGAGAAGVRVGDDERAEGCEPRIDRRPRPHLGAQRPRRVGGRLRLRAARRRRPADSQPDQRARREDGLRAGARGDDPRRSRQPRHDARAARRLLRRGAAAREGGAGHRERGDHRHAAARPQPHLGRRRDGRDLRARQVSVGLRARRLRGLPGRDGRARCWPGATSPPATWPTRSRSCS